MGSDPLFLEADKLKKKGGQTPCVINVRVRYAETDRMGVVYHANYLVWFEVGRCELLRASGSSSSERSKSLIALA